MILGIGTDLVEINRFALWHNYSDAQLQKIFVVSEIEQYKKLLDKKLYHQAATFLASRYAVKEAFYKALCAAYLSIHHTSFLQGLLFVSQNSEVISDVSGVPYLRISDALYQEFCKKWYKKPLKIYSSISHEKDNALAFVVIE